MEIIRILCSILAETKVREPPPKKLRFYGRRHGAAGLHDESWRVRRDDRDIRFGEKNSNVKSHKPLNKGYLGRLAAQAIRVSDGCDTSNSEIENFRLRFVPQ